MRRRGENNSAGDWNAQRRDPELLRLMKTSQRCLFKKIIIIHSETRQELEGDSRLRTSASDSEKGECGVSSNENHLQVNRIEMKTKKREREEKKRANTSSSKN